MCRCAQPANPFKPPAEQPVLLYPPACHPQWVIRVLPMHFCPSLADVATWRAVRAFVPSCLARLRACLHLKVR